MLALEVRAFSTAKSERDYTTQRKKKKTIKHTYAGAVLRAECLRGTGERCERISSSMRGR